MAGAGAGGGARVGSVVVSLLPKRGMGPGNVATIIGESKSKASWKLDCGKCLQKRDFGATWELATAAQQQKLSSPEPQLGATVVTLDVAPGDRRDNESLSFSRAACVAARVPAGTVLVLVIEEQHCWQVRARDSVPLAQFVLQKNTYGKFWKLHTRSMLLKGDQVVIQADMHVKEVLVRKGSMATVHGSNLLSYRVAALGAFFFLDKLDRGFTWEYVAPNMQQQHNPVHLLPLPGVPHPAAANFQSQSHHQPQRFLAATQPAMENRYSDTVSQNLRHLPPPPGLPAYTEPPLHQQRLMAGTQDVMGTDERVAALREQLAVTCDQHPALAMADKRGIVVTIHSKAGGSGSSAGSLDFGYVPVDEQRLLEHRSVSSRAGNEGDDDCTLSSSRATKRGTARFVAVPEPKPTVGQSRYVKIQNRNQTPVTLYAVEFIPDYEGIFQILLPAGESNVLLKRERRGGQLLARLIVQPQDEVMLQVRCRPADVMRFYATWLALHFELSREGTVLDSIVHSCTICRKAVAVAIRKSEIKTLNAEAKQFVPRFLQTTFDTPLCVHQLTDHQSKFFPANPATHALGSFKFTALNDDETKSAAQEIQKGLGTTATSYQGYFVKLLQLEEQQMERDITMYNMYNQVLRPVRGSDSAVTITVKGVVEHRPALTFGDVVRFRVADDKASSTNSLPANLSEWEGRVMDVKNTTVTVQLCDDTPARWTCGICAQRAFFLATPCGCHLCETCLRTYILQKVNTLCEDEKVSFTTSGRMMCPNCTDETLARQGCDPSLRNFALQDLTYSPESTLRKCRPWQAEWQKFVRVHISQNPTVSEAKLADLWRKIESDDDACTRESPLFLTRAGVKVHVRFCVNRLAIRHMHRVLECDIPRIWPRLQCSGGTHTSTTAVDTRAGELQRTRCLCNSDFQWSAKADGDLNGEQMLAVRCIVNKTHGWNPMVVFGPPGTGKTLTMVEAVVQILVTDPTARILCTGPSDSSADTFAERLVEVGKEGHVVSDRLTRRKLCRINSPQRLGGMAAVKPELLPFCPMQDGQFVVPSANELAEFDVVVSTCAGAGLLQTAAVTEMGREGWDIERERPGSAFSFSHIFIDEASQAMEPESLIAVALGGESTCVIMAGDHKQLGVSVRSRAAGQLELSLMERLISLPHYSAQLEDQSQDTSTDGERCVVKLLNNYRSHEDILKISSELFYDGELRACANPIETKSLCAWELLRSPQDDGETEYFDEEDARCPVMFFGVQGIEMHETDSPSWFNPVEGSKIVDLIEGLLNSSTVNVNVTDIGVIAFYRQQVLKLRLMLRERNLSTIRVGGVNDYQGQEARIIFISTVVAKQRQFDPAVDPIGGNRDGSETAKKFNVALTRGKALNVVVGNPLILETDPCWRRLIEFTAEHGSYRGCRCATTRGTESCDEEEDDMEALVSEISKIGQTALGKINGPPESRGVCLWGVGRATGSRVLERHVPNRAGLVLPGRGGLASCVVSRKGHKASATACGGAPMSGIGIVPLGFLVNLLH